MTVVSVMSLCSQESLPSPEMFTLNQDDQGHVPRADPALAEDDR